MATIVTLSDLPAGLQSAELVDTMLAAANARASRVAPCLADETTPPSEEHLAEARLVLIGAVKRWVETGAGSLQSQTAGPFGITVDTRQRTGFNFWPSEVAGLQEICGTTRRGRAFGIDTMPPASA